MPDENSKPNTQSTEPTSSTPSRREFLKSASVGAALPIVASPVGESPQEDNPLYQPKEFWEKRMTPPR